MSKKKNTSKKHKFKHVDPEVVSSSTGNAHEGAVRTPALQANRTAASPMVGRDFSYVTKDVRRIGIMVGGLVALELAFYYVLMFTPVGSAIYRLVNV